MSALEKNIIFHFTWVHCLHCRFFVVYCLSVRQKGETAITQTKVSAALIWLNSSQKCTSAANMTTFNQLTQSAVSIVLPFSRISLMLYHLSSLYNVSFFFSVFRYKSKVYNLPTNAWPDGYAATTLTGSVWSLQPAHHKLDDSQPSHTHTLHVCAHETKAGLVHIQRLYKKLRDIFLIFEQLISCKSCLISLHLS